jgi:hypothetical protein
MVGWIGLGLDICRYMFDNFDFARQAELYWKSKRNNHYCQLNLIKPMAVYVLIEYYLTIPHLGHSNLASF